MKYPGDIGFGLWSLLNIGGAGVVACIAYGLLRFRYDVMHTISSLNFDPSLTRETVVHNVVRQTASSMLTLLIFAAVFWGLNYGIYLGGRSIRYKKAGLWVSCACSFILLLGIVAADYYCLSKYPQQPKTTTPE